MTQERKFGKFGLVRFSSGLISGIRSFNISGYGYNYKLGDEYYCCVCFLKKISEEWLLYCT